jgi:GntR family transcriptional regulator
MSSRSSNNRFRFQLDLHSGVPVYRQVIDQVRGGIASGSLAAGDQLPTVRQLAVDLAINPNTVVRAYRELELGGLLETHQGTGTFIGAQKMKRADAERERQLAQIVSDCASRAGAAGFTVDELIEALRGLASEPARRR